ncbi:MAG: hypothetical protein IJO72_05160 [Oscillospiraceae bacterium]|nr:hypothetical protein [Oscillospiraceae bacterium]
MNVKNLKKVFDHYVEKFEWLNQKPEPNESYKWLAVQEFQNAFNLEVPKDEFATMLYNAWKASANLIDSNQQQPFYALVEYARREPERVRGMFENLYADDGGDLTIRQKKVENFLYAADELLKKYFPSSHLFINTQRSVMALLWFYDPNTYYYYKATEAKYLADCVEFYDDWGTYTDFKLDVFHRFCDEIVEQMRNHPALMETHKSRFESKEPMHKDENLHILVVDIIFCAKRYGLYDGIPIKDPSAPAKRLYLARKAKAAELYEAVQVAEKNVILLNEASTVFIDLVQSGNPIYHKAFGPAELIECADGYVTLFFPGKNEQKKFILLQSLVGGFIKIDTPNFGELLEKYRQAMCIEESAVRLYKSAVKALEPYKEYLD